VGSTVFVRTPQLNHNGLKAAINNMQTHKHSWVPIKLYWWSLKFRSHTTFPCHKILLGVFLFFKLQMWKWFLAHKLYKNKQQVGFGLWARVCHPPLENQIFKRKASESFLLKRNIIIMIMAHIYWAPVPWKDSIWKTSFHSLINTRDR
jgi:hypothetical protein